MPDKRAKEDRPPTAREKQRSDAFAALDAIGALALWLDGKSYDFIGGQASVSATYAKQYVNYHLRKVP